MVRLLRVSTGSTSASRNRPSVCRPKRPGITKATTPLPIPGACRPRTFLSLMYNDPPMLEPDARMASTPLAGDPTSASNGRNFVASVLGSWGFTGFVDIAELLTSELVTNAILHSRSDMELTVRCDGAERVRVEVRDFGRGRPVRRHAPKRATSGRGLDMVYLLATDWGVEYLRQGKRVWFELDGQQADG